MHACTPSIHKHRSIGQCWRQLCCPEAQPLQTWWRRRHHALLRLRGRQAAVHCSCEVVPVGVEHCVMMTHDMAGGAVRGVREGHEDQQVHD